MSATVIVKDSMLVVRKMLQVVRRVDVERRFVHLDSGDIDCSLPDPGTRAVITFEKGKRSKYSAPKTQGTPRM